MNERGRIALVLGAVAVIGGGAFYVFKVYMPGRDRAHARDEVVAWEKRLAAARECLLGDKPASGDSAEALAVRELAPDPWNRKTCTTLIGQLSRGEANDTGIPAVEQAWEAVDKATGRVATSFATHVDPFGEKSEDRGKPSPLPSALQELDKAHAALAAAAGLPAPATTTLPALPKAEIVPVRDGADALTWLDTPIRPSVGGMVMFGRAGDHSLEVVLPIGGAPKLGKLATDAIVRALPDLTWGAAFATDDETHPSITVGPVGDAGAFTAMSSVATSAPPTILALAGTQADGVIAFTAGDQLQFARATGGQPFAIPAGAKPVTSTRSTAGFDLTGRAALAWVGSDGAMTGTLLAGGAEPKLLPLGSSSPVTPALGACLTSTHVWAGEPPQYVRFDATAAQPHVLPGFDLVGCNDKHALFRKFTDDLEFAVCDEGCRMVKIPNLAFTIAVGLAGDEVVAIRTHRGVVGVWREHGAPAFYSFPGDRFSTQVVQSDGKVIDIVGDIDGKATILRVPAA